MTTNSIIHVEWINKILNGEAMSLQAIYKSNFFSTVTQCATKQRDSWDCFVSYGSSWLLPSSVEVNQ